jgi:ornithine cyclodeaminase/alanine dehydrogenase-like protein (mu-crystallin family)
VRRLLTMPDALAALDSAFRELAGGRAENQPRRRVRGGAVLAVMSAALPAVGLIGFKAYTVGPEGARFYVHLFDSTSGRLRAVLEGDHLGRVRTGAASGLATRYLAEEEATVMTVVGTGSQALTQVQAVAAVRPLREVRVVGREAGRRARLADDLQRELQLNAVPMESVEKAVAGAAVVTTITSSASPVLLGDWLSPGQHLNVAGSNIKNRREVDGQAVARAALLVADDPDAARVEAGDLLLAEQEGSLEWSLVHSLSAVASGSVRRRHAADITLFKSVGLAIEDVAAGAVVLERAEKEGAGEMLSL